MRPFLSFDLQVFIYAASFTSATAPSTVETGSSSCPLFHSTEVNADGGVGILVGLRSRCAPWLQASSPVRQPIFIASS